MNLDYYKTFLWPQEELLRNICFEQTDPWSIEIIPYIEASNASFIYSLSETIRLKELWLNNYRCVHELNSKLLDAFEKENKSQGFTQRFRVASSELIKNTFEHGNKGKGGAVAHFGYWLTDKGIVVGIKDEGEFYSKLETKNIIESKIMIPTSKEGFGGSGISRCLYKYSDLTYVSTEQNALFACFLFNSNLEA